MRRIGAGEGEVKSEEVKSEEVKRKVATGDFSFGGALVT